ncbi:MAG: DUF4287 domain-containing protein [Terrimonas sp.]|nr:DUF4287 domain-containing protein [Terrimonas sp.]
MQKAAKTQLDNIEKNTGKKISEWISVVNKSGFSKHGELVKFLKEKHGFTHGNANLLVHVAKQSHAGAVDDTDELIDGQYQGKELLRSWYEMIMEKVRDFGEDITIAPKKAYISIRRKKQFAIIQPSTKERLDIGLNIKGVPPSGKLTASGTWNAMCTHRIKLEQENDINKDLLAWIKKAYDKAV